MISQQLFGILLFFYFYKLLTPKKLHSQILFFSLTDPTWHIAFRKYKLIIVLPLTIAFVIIGRIYENPNVALFALGAMAFTACVPYFEREFSSHIAVANHKGEMYLREQLKAGLLNTMILLCPLDHHLFYRLWNAEYSNSTFVCRFSYFGGNY